MINFRTLLILSVVYFYEVQQINIMRYKGRKVFEINVCKKNFSLAGAVRSMMTVTIALETPESVFLALMFTSMFTEGSADVVWNNTFCFLSFFLCKLYCQS